MLLNKWALLTSSNLGIKPFLAEKWVKKNAPPNPKYLVPTNPNWSSRWAEFQRRPWKHQSRAETLPRVLRQTEPLMIEILVEKK